MLNIGTAVILIVSNHSRANIQYNNMVASVILFLYNSSRNKKKE